MCLNDINHGGLQMNGQQCCSALRKLAVLDYGKRHAQQFKKMPRKCSVNERKWWNCEESGHILACCPSRFGVRGKQKGLRATKSVPSIPQRDRATGRCP